MDRFHLWASTCGDNFEHVLEEQLRDEIVTGGDDDLPGPWVGLNGSHRLNHDQVVILFVDSNRGPVESSPRSIPDSLLVSDYTTVDFGNSVASLEDSRELTGGETNRLGIFSHVSPFLDDRTERR